MTALSLALSAQHLIFRHSWIETMLGDQRNFAVSTTANEFSLEIIMFNDGIDGLPLLMELSTDLVSDDLLTWRFLTNDTDNFITNSNAVCSRLCLQIQRQSRFVYSPFVNIFTEWNNGYDLICNFPALLPVIIWYFWRWSPVILVSVARASATLSFEMDVCLNLLTDFQSKFSMCYILILFLSLTGGFVICFCIRTALYLLLGTMAKITSKIKFVCEKWTREKKKVTKMNRTNNHANKVRFGADKLRLLKDASMNKQAQSTHNKRMMAQTKKRSSWNYWEECERASEWEAPSEK